MNEAKDYITCQQCGYKIDQFTGFRCPRCMALLLVCGSCNGNCKKCMATSSAKTKDELDKS